ncbi:MAG: hypothetical protein ACI4J7_06995 [Ruminiclostridium sp.]
MRDKRDRRKKIFSLFEKRLAKNFQPLRAKRAARQTTGNNSKDLLPCCFFLGQYCKKFSRKTANVHKKYPNKQDHKSSFLGWSALALPRGSRGRAAPWL